MDKLKSKVCFVGVDPTLLVRLGSPDRLRPSDILVVPKRTTTTTRFLIYINFNVLYLAWNLRFCYENSTLSNFGSQISLKKLYFVLWIIIKHSVYSVFEKKIFWPNFKILKKMCFDPKKIDGKSLNGHNSSSTEPKCKCLGILERSR